MHKISIWVFNEEIEDHEEQIVEAKSCPFDHTDMKPSANSLMVTYAGERDKYWVTCLVCWGEGPMADTEEDAISFWNKRAKAE